MKEAFEYTGRVGKRNGVIIFFKSLLDTNKFEVLVYSQDQNVEQALGKFTNLRAPHERYTKKVS